MSELDVLDPRFGQLMHPKREARAAVDRRAVGRGAWPISPPGGTWFFSDIPNDRLMRYDETSGVVSVFREPSGNGNGNTVDREGRLVSCEHKRNT